MLCPLVLFAFTCASEFPFKVVKVPAAGVVAPIEVLSMPPTDEMLPASVIVTGHALYAELQNCRLPPLERIDLFGVVAPFPASKMFAPFVPVFVMPSVVAWFVESETNNRAFALIAPLAATPSANVTIPVEFDTAIGLSTSEPLT
ncbi:hypothetical protein A8H32_11740 [Burkholderia thailandensis]|nr:hypothetical protein AQ475_05155 [Burkholderia thailandensis]AVR25698.1 hypothetical protein A8H32_11740 [Burkholderia thailandensis]